MFTVALLGPDGAGKTTIGRSLARTLQVPIKYLYMGINADSSNRALPTTRLIRAIKRACGAKGDTTGPPDPNHLPAQPKSLVRRIGWAVKSWLSLANRVADEWFRQTLAWSYRLRGHIVLFDRHYFFDYYAYDIANTGQRRSLTKRIHGFILAHFFPKPDLVICLDAPGDVLFARKGEGTPQSLERRRQEYLQICHLVKHFVVVDANQPEECVSDEVRDHILEFYRSMVGAIPGEAKSRRPSNSQQAKESKSRGF